MVHGIIKYLANINFNLPEFDYLLKYRPLYDHINGKHADSRQYFEDTDWYGAQERYMQEGGLAFGVNQYVCI